MKKPNVLWLMTDEQRTDSLGCYHSPWANTPRLDALAESGVVFDNALSASPVCVPARTSMLTGLYPHDTRVWHNRVPEVDLGNLLDQFHAAGYQSATFGKQHHRLARKPFETSGGVGYGKQATHFFHYKEPYKGEDYDMVQYPGIFPWILGGVYPETAESKMETGVVDLALDWFNGRDKERPFFLRVSFSGPHTPVTPPKPFDSLIPDESIRFPPETEDRQAGLPAWLDRDWAVMNSADPLSNEQVTVMRRHYYGFVSFLDQQFARVLDELDRAGELENTIIAFVSDHGTLLGDYGFVQKGTFYEPDNGVPFFFCGPGIPAGTRLKTPVSSASILPTLLELAGLAYEPLPGVHDAAGESWSAAASGPGAATVDGPLPSLARAIAEGSEPEARPILSEITGVPPGMPAARAPGPFRGYRHHLPRALVRDGNLKLAGILDPGLDELLLTDLENDPLETTNKADEPAYSGEVDRLRGVLEEATSGKLPNYGA